MRSESDKPVTGRLYYDTDAANDYMWDGHAWMEVKVEVEHREQLERYVGAALSVGGGFAVLVVTVWLAFLPSAYDVFVPVFTGVALLLLGLARLVIPVWRRARAR